MDGLQRDIRFGTGVVQFCDDAEQRWKAQGALAAFTLEFRNIDGYDLANLLEFFRSMKGAFDSTWELTLGENSYANLCFDQDECTWTETKPNRFSLSLRVRQTRSA